jgi:hypothetical protein
LTRDVPAVETGKAFGRNNTTRDEHAGNEQVLFSVNTNESFDETRVD